MKKHLQYLWRRRKWKHLVKKKKKHFQQLKKRLLNFRFLQVVSPRVAASAGWSLLHIHSHHLPGRSRPVWQGWRKGSYAMRGLAVKRQVPLTVARADLRLSSIQPFLALLSISSTLTIAESKEGDLSPICFYTQLLRINMSDVSPHSRPFWKLLLT